jgi:hypothetical protein
MEPIEFSALTGAGSALVAALSYLAKTNHERRRVTRTVLYYLLELHHVTHRVRSAVLLLETELVKQLRIAYKSRDLPFNDAEATLAFVAAKPLLVEFGRKQLEGTVSTSAEAFAKALSDLARENPVLAFRLRGRDQITLLRQKIEGFAGLSGANDSAGPRSPGLEWPQLDPLLFEVAEEELRQAIRATVWGCDVVTHFKAKRLLRSAGDEQVSSQFKDLLKQVAENYVASLASQRTSPN